MLSGYEGACLPVRFNDEFLDNNGGSTSSTSAQNYLRSSKRDKILAVAPGSSCTFKNQRGHVTW